MVANFTCAMGRMVKNLSLLLVVLLFYPFVSLSHQHLEMIFQRRLSRRKSPRVFRTLLIILVNLNNAVIWMVSTRPLICKSSSPFINPLVTVPRAPIRNGITVTSWSTFSFCSLARLRYLFFLLKKEENWLNVSASRWEDRFFIML